MTPTDLYIETLRLEGAGDWNTILSLLTEYRKSANPMELPWLNAKIEMAMYYTKPIESIKMRYKKWYAKFSKGRAS